MAEITHFERLGLPLDFALDAAALERHYLERSRAVHPDHTGNDPGAADQLTCGGLSHTIDIESFASPGDISGQFVPFLRDFFCHSSPDTVYINGGTWAIYSISNADVMTIAAKMGVQPTRLC